MNRRPTRDLIVIILAVGFVAALAAAVVGLVVLRADDPSTDLGGPVAAVGSILTGVFGVIVGFVLGRKNGEPH